MNRQQYLLTKLAEEASEITQIALKTQQFGFLEKHPDLKENNIQRIHKELNDLITIVCILNTEFDFNYSVSIPDVEKKYDKIEKYYKYSQELGEVQ
jgi:NTP pyrophosphatase (non-canonical NTP hydrolase)